MCDTCTAQPTGLCHDVNTELCLRAADVVDKKERVTVACFRVRMNTIRGPGDPVSDIVLPQIGSGTRIHSLFTFTQGFFDYLHASLRLLESFCSGFGISPGALGRSRDDFRRLGVI